MMIHLGHRNFDSIWWISLLLLIIITSEIKTANANNAAQLPQIEFRTVSFRWKNVTKVLNSTSQFAKYSFYDDFGGDLFVTCTSTQPIEWKLTGTISPPDIVNMGSIKKDVESSKYSLKLSFYLRAATKFPNLAFSADIICQEINNLENRQEFSIFVKGYNGPFVVPKTSPVLETEQAKIIPCPTTDPISSTLLYYKYTNNSEIFMENVTYNPTVGFRRLDNAHDSFDPGNYTCRNGHFSFPVTVVGSLTENKYSPVANTVLKLSEEYIEFHCSSKNKPVNFTLHDHKNITQLVYTTAEPKEKMVKLAVIGGRLPSQIHSIQGKISCATEDDELVKTWNFEFIEAPKLYIDNYKSEVHCLTPHTNKTILQTVRCHHGMHCDLMRSCLQDETLCNLKYQKQFYVQDNGRCWVREQNEGFPCLTMPFNHMNGLVKCGVFGLEKIWDFFISLDNRRYIDWRDAPLKELVRIEEINPEDYPIMESSHFKCSAVAFLFADSLYFEINYRNGSHSVTKGEEVKDTTVAPLAKIVGFNIVAILKKDDLPEDAVKISCFAPLWNSTQVLQASKVIK